MSQFDIRDAGDYIAPQGLYQQNKARPFLGDIRCSHRQVTAGAWEEIQLVYTVGASGLADGAWIKLAFKFYSDWALFQTSEPTAANFISAEYQAGPLVPGQSPATVQHLAVRFDQKGHERPFQKAILIDIVDGYLNPGDRIIIRLGDRRHGGGGTRVQSFVEKDFRFRLFVDPLGSSKFAEVPGDVLLDIVPGAPYKLSVIAPRLLPAGTSFDAIVRLDDVWGNTCRDLPLSGRLTFTPQRGVPQAAPFTLAQQGWAVARLSGVQLTAPGEWRLEAALADYPQAAGRSHIRIDDSPNARRPLYADLHVHSDDTVGTNDTLYNLSYGRDVAGLDVLGYTANDFNITEARWNSAVALINQLNRPGVFVCYAGTEWCGNTCAGGDHNVVFLSDDAPQFPFDRQGRLVRSFEWNEFTAGTIKPGAWPLDELYAAYAREPHKHLLIPHIGGRRCNLDWHHPELERLIEVSSAWGQFHWVYAEALERGYRLGASANSDEHQGRCGGGVPATAVFGSRGGLTGVLARRFDRAGVAEALRARHTFATTGERSYAELRYGDALMGDVAPWDVAVPLSYRLLGDAGWESLTLYDGASALWSRDLHQELGRSARHVRVRLGGARIRDRYRGACWRGTIDITGTPINHFALVGADHPEQTVWRAGHTQIALRTDTNGDSDCIEIGVGALRDAALHIRLTIDGYVKVGDARTPQPHAFAPTFETEVKGADLLARGKIGFSLAGVELEVEIEAITAAALPIEVAGEIELSRLTMADKKEHALFLSARQKDQSRVWTSALFLTR
ncbi:hypothetical protein [Affinibrenneria salicis]|uniref:hypothetical protein n=1 Tax=Affinibrenneria salicis TaxID=2590031 RepID=UPI001CC708A5|nr:hypothetical protein [Affinibrenneria salicis]